MNTAGVAFSGKPYAQAIEQRSQAEKEGRQRINIGVVGVALLLIILIAFNDYLAIVSQTGLERPIWFTIGTTLLAIGSLANFGAGAMILWLQGHASKGLVGRIYLLTAIIFGLPGMLQIASRMSSPYLDSSDRFLFDGTANLLAVTIAAGITTGTIIRERNKADRTAAALNMQAVSQPNRTSLSADEGEALMKYVRMTFYWDLNDEDTKRRDEWIRHKLPTTIGIPNREA